MQTEKLIQSLIEQTRQHMNHVEKLKTYDMHVLTWRANDSSWSILECLEHLNLYGEFYLPQIESQIKRSNSKSETEFKSGLLGNYFAKSMLPKETLNSMNTFKDKNPIHADLNSDVMDKFLNQEIRLLNLLHQSRHVSLNKVKIPTSISSLIKLKLGDTFQFFINHITRHLKQIGRIEQTMNVKL